MVAGRFRLLCSDHLVKFGTGFVQDAESCLLSLSLVLILDELLLCERGF
jgi:hypothetical protein